jgi:predicted phage tail protein
LLTSLGQVNGVVLAQEDASSETPVATEEAPTPEVTETPEIIAEPTEVLPTETPIDPLPTETVTQIPTAEGDSGVTALDGAPANDLIPNATVMSLDTVYTANSAGATISPVSEGDELADPVNVCNTGDTYSLWYEFTAPADGVYRVNTYGSNRYASRNLTVLEKLDATTRTPVVCGEINPYGIDYEDYFSLSFYGTENTTYLFGISGNLDGDSIVVKVEQPQCESGHICGAAVDGDGSVIHSPTVSVYDGDEWVYANQNGRNFSSFFSVDLSAFSPAQYNLVVRGGKSLIIEENVAAPGILNASAVGYQKVLLDTKDTAGEYFKPGSFVIYRNLDYLGSALYLDSSEISNPQEFYLAPGIYDFEAVSDSGLLQIYRPGVSVVGSDLPQTISLNAHELAADTFRFHLDGLDRAKISFSIPMFSNSVDVDENSVVTFAAPSGRDVSSLNAEMFVKDEDDQEWDYISLLGWNVPIVGEQEHVYTIGGPISFQVSVEDDIVYIEDGGGQINTSLVDAHGNHLSYVYGFAEGETSKSYLPVNLNFYDPNNSLVASKSVTNFYYPIQFSIPTDKDLGIWTVEASIDLGPLGGGLQTASTTFTVDSLANHPVVNDDFDSATVIDSMPYSLEGYNTRGSTPAADDPILAGVPTDWWGNSVWFKYAPTQSGILTLDTIGQNYGTLLTVWKGSRGALSNVTINDNYYDPETGETQPYSKVSFPVSAGQTYYIMVQGFTAFGSSGYGKLNLHGSLAANPNCYSLSVSTNSTTYGTVQVLTVPNCGTKYIEGTKVTLSAVAKPNYGFYNWSDGSTEDPYQVTINANTTLKANFVKMVAPVVSSPAASALINDASVNFTWGATQYADTYQIQIDSQSNFALPIDQDETVDTLTYESPTLTPDGVKYYRVRAINAYGDAGPWSAVRSFTLDTQPPAAPTLTSPANAAWIVGVPSYTWAAVTGANAYRFEYDTEADFSHAITSAVLGSTSYKPMEQIPGTYYWRVWARDAAGNWSTSASSTNSVTVLTAVPPAPKITPFSNGPLVKSASIVLNWGAAYFADTYNLQISSSSAFTTLLINASLGADTLSYNFSAPNDGDFYTRVRALNSSAEASPWSAVYKFTVDTLAPAVPTLLSPIGNSYPGTITPKLILAAVSTAKTYEYQVDDSGSFATPILNVSSSSAAYATTASQALPLGLLYWRARAVDAAGNASDWSAPQAFYQTNQKTPNTTAVVTVATPTFTWSALAGATGYRLLVCQDEGMTDCVIDKTLGPVTKYISPIVFSPEVYYWQISVVGGVFNGQTTLPIKFSVSPIIPASPRPSYPANGASLSTSTPGLSWTSVSTALSYEIQINQASTFTADGLELTTGDGTIVSTSLADGKYYWRVRAIDENGAFSKWSSISVFTVDTLKPDAPSLISPATEEVVGSQLPKLTLSKVTDAALYEYQASQSADFSTVILDKTVNAIAYTLVNGQQLPLGQIYWRARVIDAANNVSAWTAAKSFWVTTQKLPANGSFITTTQPQFTWAAVPNALTYSLKVCKQVDLTDCVLALDLNAVTGYKPSTSLDLGKYYWQLSVQTKDSPERMITPVLSFTITPASLAAPVLLTPAVNLVTNDTTVEMTWQLVPEAENYEVQISQLANFATLVETSTLPETATTSTSLPDGRYYWRVRTLNTYDAPGKWSAVRNFTVDTLATVAPVAASPLQGTLVNTLTPKLSVKAVNGAKSYQFKVFPTGSPADVWADVTVNAPTVTLTLAQALKFGSFSWQVRTIDTAGNLSDWSEPLSFIVSLQKSPLNASYTKVANTTFTWAAFAGATGYRVKICEDQAMETACSSSPDLSAKTLKYVLPAPLADGIYYWQIEVLGTTLENPVTPVLRFIKVH